MYKTLDSNDDGAAIKKKKTNKSQKGNIQNIEQQNIVEGSSSE